MLNSLVNGNEYNKKSWLPWDEYTRESTSWCTFFEQASEQVY
jgi:hypothetical protein